MSWDARFEHLEAEITAALRRAPGVEPSSDLDARIRARAHAAAAPVARRAQPRWLAVAAGLMVLVGSGLALRIMQQVERAPGPLDEPLQSVPAPAAVDARASAAAPADADAAVAESGLAREPALAPAPIRSADEAIPERSALSPIGTDPDPAADKLSAPASERAAPAAKAASTAPPRPSEPPAISERARVQREPAKPFPATSDARTGPPSAPPTPVAEAPMAAPEPKPAPAAPPPPPAAMDDGYARESVAGNSAPPADSPAPPDQEQARMRSEPFSVRDQDAQPGADARRIPRSDNESRTPATELDERAGAGVLAAPPATAVLDAADQKVDSTRLDRIEVTGSRIKRTDAVSGLASEAAEPNQEFESVDAATAARRAADYELRVEAIRMALERGERRHARELAAALERDFPDSILPRALRRQLAR